MDRLPTRTPAQEAALALADASARRAVEGSDRPALLGFGAIVYHPADARRQGGQCVTGPYDRDWCRTHLERIVEGQPLHVVATPAGALDRAAAGLLPGGVR